MMKLSLKQPIRVCKFFKVSAVFILVFSSLFVYNSWSNYDELVLEKDSLKRVIQNRNKVYPSVSNYEKKDWHDWAFIEYEKSRVGPGEQGAAYELTDSKDIELDDKLFEIEGLSVVVSDKISVNRSIPDYRHPKCSEIQYLKKLPSTSVIVIFHNEYPSILKRTIHSIYNRTPRELLVEILMVNDGSTKEELYKPLQSYVKENFDERVKIVNLAERSGLIVARMEGVRKAKGEVVMFMDAHMEAYVNWLPPLLEPIVLNPKTSTVPTIGTFKFDTFRHKHSQKPKRGVFDWNFIYRFLPLYPEDQKHLEKPVAHPVMLGGAFAIRRDYFLDLGGYDEQLLIWNGENYELSFKLWLCGGQILLVPCSIVGHVFRRHNEYRQKKGIDFITHNFKRIAEVWLDDYKECLYKREPEKYAKIDYGNVEKQKLIRQNLNCKPFKYFLDHLMPDMKEKFPCVEPGVFASGAIQSEADPTMCVDTIPQPYKKNSTLSTCHKNLTLSEKSMTFVLTWHRNIENENYSYCLVSNTMNFEACDYNFKKQLWYYNLTTHQIVNPPSNECLTANLSALSLNMKNCSLDDKNQKWLWVYVNESALLNWETFGDKITKIV